ncbi:hypothetical protein GCM10023215_67200 [Pseudonocardia yuanmonensis]|uniref:Uncharacterized protein n=1 Tax=Pseudonocardia yuanmonensis TaxID=1095914 RepID=A0ABP8XTR9_9PSEU
MWNDDEFIAKAIAYFEKADVSPASADDPVDADAAMWLLLGLEFVLRAPLARVHPTLLAVPEGTSILHAAGYAPPNSNPRSIPTKTVVERLAHIEPAFNDDRKRDALFLADLRNGELHTSAAVLESLEPEVWLPRFLTVVESLCNHLNIFVDDLLPATVYERASAARVVADKALRAAMQKKIESAREFFTHLRADEVEARAAARPPRPTGKMTRTIECPACAKSTAIVSCGPGRTSRGTYDEDAGTIDFSITYLAESLDCHTCDFTLETTNEIIAAGLPRLHIDRYEEDRYEGWENVVSHSDVIEHLGIGEPDYDYGND